MDFFFLDPSNCKHLRVPKDLPSPFDNDPNGIHTENFETETIETPGNTCGDTKPDRDVEYKPFENRMVQHPTSTIGSFFHLLKSSLGSGLLAMPAAFKHAGLIPGVIGTVLVAAIATHCVQILVQTSRDICKQRRIPLLSYTETCELSFKGGPSRLRPYSGLVRHFVDFSMAGVCLGGTSVYVVFVAASVKDICDHFYPETKLRVEVYCGMLLIPLVFITQLRHLKFLVPFSLFANCCLMLTVIITCRYTFVDLPGLEDIHLVGRVESWPLFLSTAIFAMEGINVVMPVENEMAKPQDFLGCPGVLNLTMALVCVLYGIVGIFGYLKYGEGVLGSVTLNLPQDETLALVAKILVTTAVFFTYCLQMYAPMDIIWSRIRSRVSLGYHNIAQIALRTISVLFTVILAASIPDLELLIGVVGAIFFSTLGLFIPVMVETVHRWNFNLGSCNYVLWKNFALFIVYLIVLVSGCYASVSEIIIRHLDRTKVA